MTEKKTNESKEKEEVRQENMEKNKEKTEDLVETEENQIMEKPEGPYITRLLEAIKEDFQQVNVGLDVDFVYMADWLLVNKKGQFYERDDEDVNYGDTIDVVIAAGEKRWTLWGQQDSPEDGLLIVAEREKEDAVAALGNWLQENPEATERYAKDDLELRYVAYIVPIESLKDEFPQVYLMNFPKSDTIGFGNYTMRVYKGKYKEMGVPARTGVNKVVTRITTVERENGNNSWIGRDFEAVGMFNPEEYGIDPDKKILGQA